MNISILGVTGSIGRQTIKVAEALGFRVKAIAAGSDSAALREISMDLQPDLTVSYEKHGMDGLLECASMPGVQIVVNAIVGSVGLRPTMAAIAAGKDVALANKETLVAAGPIVMESARKNGVSIRPIDSEHSAIWQCLGQPVRTSDRLDNRLKRLILTASGGAFREWDKDSIAKAKAADALKHPNWNMGPKITIDCATMMNKGLEYIEAHWLFDVPYEKIDILIHPQSIIHSMVEFGDGAVLAQMAAPDMGQPIQYALCAPDRPPREHERLEFTRALTFDEPDFDRFPCLALAMEAAHIGGSMPAMMNAANEILVQSYLSDNIGFYDISRLIEEAMGTYTVRPVESIADVEESEAWAKEFCERKILCQF